MNEIQAIGLIFFIIDNVVFFGSYLGMHHRLSKK